MTTALTPEDLETLIVLVEAHIEADPVTDHSEKERLVSALQQEKQEWDDLCDHIEDAFERMDRMQAGCREWDNAEIGGI